LISIKDLKFAYDSKLIVDDISLSISDGEFIGIIGPNGAGKSTLIKLIEGILVPKAGKLLLNELPISAYKRKTLAKIVGYVPQTFSTAFEYSAYDIVMMGRFPYLSVFSSENEQDKNIVRKSMEETDIWDLRNRLFSELSGGEKQRVVLASALAQQPKMLLLDEPTAALDIKHQLHFHEILKSLQQIQQMTIVTITHDVNLATRYCDRIIVLKDGRVIADGEPSRIIDVDLISRVYGVDVTIIRHPGDGKPLLVLSGS
jgi:iron complex transport system ATP-binding protein